MKTSDILQQVLTNLKLSKETNGQTIGNLIKKLNKNMFEWETQLKNMTPFLIEASNAQRLYHIWFDETKIPNCTYCDKTLKFNSNGKFSLDKHAYHGNYKMTCGSTECEHKYISEVKKKVQEEIRNDPDKWNKRNENTKANNLKKYGVEWHVKSKGFLKKSQETCMINHGVKNGAQSKQAKETSKKTFLKNYGVEFYLQSTDAKQKIEEFYSNLGVTHNTHIPEIFDKMTRSGYKRKDYIFPSGKLTKVQGYENRSIDRLLAEGFLENDIITNTKEIEQYTGIIWYYTQDGKKHRYYPDIYIKSLNKILEVKSTYTFTQDKEKNLLKKEACLNLGFNFEFDVYDKINKVTIND